MNLQTRYQNIRNLHPSIRMVISRTLAFLVFTVVVYVWGYLPAYKNDSFTQVAGFFDNTIRAANDGYSLMTYDSKQPDKLIKLTDISGGYYDMGWSTMVSLAVRAGKIVYGDNYRADSSVPYKVVIAFNLITAVLFLLPIVPFFISIGGLLALAISIIGLPPLYNAFGQFWGATYAAIVLSVLVSTIALKSVTFGRGTLAFATITGVIIGIAQFIRNEATVSSLACVVATLFGMWLLVLLYRVSLKQNEGSMRRILGLARNVTASLILFIVIVYAMPFAVRALYAFTFQQDYAATKLAMHGDGHSLYLSLGFIPNPYNIVWRDNVAMVHSELIRPGTGVESPYYMSTLRDEWIRIATSDPRLVIDNMVAKAGNLIQLLYAMPVVNIFLIAFPIILVASCVVIFRNPTIQRLLFTFSYLGLLSVSLVVPVLIHPFYSQSFQGVLLITPVILPFTLWGLTNAKYDVKLEPISANRQVMKRLLLLVGGVGAIGIVAVFVFTLIQSNRQQAIAADALAGDPYELIQAEGYRYDSAFNQFSNADQENIIAKLKLQRTPDIFVPELQEDSTQVSFFRPELLIVSTQELHLISWLGVPDQNFNVKELANGAGFIRVCANCDPLPSEYKNNPYELTEDAIDTNMLAINEGDWRGHYRMITLPILDALPVSPKWCAGLQTIASLDASTYIYQLNTRTFTCFRPNG